MHGPSRSIPLGQNFPVKLILATTCTYEKSTNYNKNIELNINKTSELKNIINKMKRRENKDTIPICSIIIFTIFNEKLIFPFCKLCQSIHNAFMVKVGSFTVYFKIMHFWWCFYNKWLLYSDKLLDLNYACVAKIVPGTTKSSLFFCMSSFWSSVFSICNRSKVGFNCFTIAQYFLLSLQEHILKHTSHKDKDGEMTSIFLSQM